MKTLEIKIPDFIDLNVYDASMIIATRLYQDAKLTAGQAGEMVGLSKRAFIEVLGRYNVSVISNSISDLYSDISNA